MAQHEAQRMENTTTPTASAGGMGVVNLAGRMTRTQALILNFTRAHTRQIGPPTPAQVASGCRLSDSEVAKTLNGLVDLGVIEAGWSLRVEEVKAVRFV